MTAVGFIGVGQMGGPMAGHLADWPGGLVVCDTRPEATAPLAERGAKVAATPAEVATTAEVISVMVLDDEQVRAVVAGPEGILATARSGTVVAVHSTIRPDTAESLAADAASDGVAVVDAPVSGGFVGAHEGTLAVLLGGDADAVERCRAPFARWAKLFVHFGPVGAGTRAKVARNLIHFVSFTAASEAQRLAEAAGLDLRGLAEVVRHSDGITGGPGAIMFRDTTADVPPGDPWYEVLVHTRTLGEKDLALALELARNLDVDLPLTRLAFERLGASLGLPHHRGSPP